jgi:hypothetical protein
MEFREDDREVNRIRYKVDINGGTIGSVRGALWQGKEVDISIQDIVDAEVDGEVPSPQSSPRQVHSFLCPPSQRTFFWDPLAWLCRVSRCSVCRFACQTDV